MRHVKAWLFVALLALLLPFGTSALADVPAIDMDRSLDLTVDFHQYSKPVPGVKFDLYRVGDIDAAAQVTLASELSAKYSITSLVDQSGWSKTARSMAEDLVSSAVQPVCTAITGSDGVGEFEVSGGLEPGLYLMVGHDAKIGSKTYFTYPFLFSLPMWDTKTNDWDYVVCVSPKYGERTSSKTTPSTPTTPTKQTTTGGTTANNGGGSTWSRLAQTGDFLLSIWPHIVLGLSLVYMGHRLRKSE